MQEHMRGFPWIRISLISIGISLLSVLAYDRYFAPKIVAIDVRGYMAAQKELYLSGKINDETLKGNLERLQRIIEGVPKNKTVLMGDVVLRNEESLKP